MGDVTDFEAMLERLKAALERQNNQAVTRVSDAPSRRMAELAEEISRVFSTKGPVAAVPSFGERELKALSAFRDRTPELDFSTLRLACSACAHYVEEERYVLLADVVALNALLSAVERYAAEPRLFRRLYDVLRRAYLGAERETGWFKGADAQEGNERLRQFLEAGFVRVHGLEPVLDWVQTFAAYPEVLSNTPGHRFARDVLAGNWQALDAACRGLGVTGASWLVREAVRSAAAQAVKNKDHADFKKHIPALLDLAAEQRFQAVRDNIYTALLTRYAEIPARPVYPELRDALIAAWKNPWLVRNESAWARVTDDARRMVAGWLKLELIQQFFAVLSEDRGQDDSRFKFWSRYHEQMDDVYIALGQNAYYSHSPDLVNLRQALEGRLLQLNGPADTHAFIMFMGDVVVVEFSQKGNAAHLYRRTDAPVRDTMRSATIGQLKNKSTGEWMPHVGAWQHRFTQELKLDHRVEPVTSPRPPLGMTRVLPNGGDRAGLRKTFAQSPNDSPGRPLLPINEEDPIFPVGFILFVRKHTLKVDDLLLKGGNLWVLTSDSNSEICRQLKSWGFAYKRGKGWWRE